MTIAIVKDGQFLHTVPEGVHVRDSNGVLRPRCKDIAEGWYEFIPAVDTSGAIAAQDEFTDEQGMVHPAVVAVPKTRKAQGTTFTVDDAAGTVTESFLYVDLTADELKEQNNAPVLAQIDALERQQLVPRITREFMRGMYLTAAIGQGLTEAKLRDKLDPAYSVAYDKLATFDDSLAVLRSQLI